jgi:hypothetical protein
LFVCLNRRIEYIWLKHMATDRNKISHLNLCRFRPRWLIPGAGHNGRSSWTDAENVCVSFSQKSGAIVGRSGRAVCRCPRQYCHLSVAESVDVLVTCNGVDGRLVLQLVTSRQQLVPMWTRLIGLIGLAAGASERLLELRSPSSDLRAPYAIQILEVFHQKSNCSCYTELI